MSQIKNLFQYLPKIWKEKDMIIYISLVCILLFSVFFTSSKLILSYQDAMEIQQQIASMQNFLKEWTDKTNILNNAEYRPVQAIQVDSVQTNLLLGLQANKLELIGFKTIPSSKKDEMFRSFELEFTGPYDVSVHFLENFHAKDALISVQNLKMEPNKGKIKSTIQYKIYIK